MTQSDQINELATALAKAQGAMQNAVMNRTNPHFRSKYADLSSVLDAIRAPLSANGLAVVQIMQPTEHGMTMRTTLMHASGQFISTDYPLPHTTKPHEMGSAITYARRYSLAALICNSSDEDDDGNAAQDAHKGNGKAPNGNGIFITAQQIAELQNLAGEVGADIPKFCKYLKVEFLGDLPAGKFESAKAALEAKRSPL
ncbi:ERF family protein [Bradyrhizobium sp. Tv2a-2]|uniref:ERF family protein n=1 Tax=Bradyrhizobium sp. Tv2a-2 TaxID=113395 RepID=UPI000402FA44|nr:ERF family protein [Bradyrhizobium sp. Tv2a-2]